MTGMAPVAAHARQTRWPPAVAAAGASVAGCATIARYGIETAQGNGSTVVAARVPLWVAIPGGGAIAVGVFAAWLGLARPYMSGGLLLVLLGWLAPSWADVGTFSQRWRIALLAAGPLVVAGVGLVIASSGTARRSRRRWVAATLAVSTAAVAVIAFGYDPFEDPNCQVICSDSPPILRHTLTTSMSIRVAAVLTLVAAAIVLAEIRYLRPPPSVLAAALLMLGLPVTHALGSLTGRSGSTALAMTFAVAGTACLGGVIAIRQLRTLSIRRAVERLAAGLSAHGRPGATLAIDGRAVHFAMPGELTWVSGDGMPVSSAGGNPESRGWRSRSEGWLVLDDDDGPAIRLALTPSADGDAVLAGLTAANRLALRNARLAAVGRARLVEVQESRRRVVAACDDERRKVERDLHDGAQQRLVSIAFALSAARARVDPSTVPGLDRAEAAVHEALAGLRRLAQGVFPSALAEDGLAAALDDFTVGNDIDALLEVSVRNDLDLQVAMAAYAVATRVLSLHAGFSSVGLCVDDVDGFIRLRAVLDGVPDHPNDVFDDVRDRVGALGGTLTVRRGHSGDLQVTAVIPCGWS